MSAQSAFQLGHHNVIVQAAGDNIDVQVGIPPHLRLVPVGARVRKQPRRAIDILNPAFQSVPVVGREEDLRFLHEWLGAEAGIAITAVVGPGGSGKTRLALEILQQLPPDWQGGFLTAEEANRFLGQENLGEWSWQKPTLVVVDYAALMASTLARWFAELADHAASKHRLRILLLERHADPKSGWYQDLASGTWQGQAVRELFSPAEPRRITPLGEATERRNVMEAGLEAAAAFVQPGKPVRGLPGPGEDAWLDQRLAANQWADPLLLLMAAVIAASDGLNAALELSRPDLAKTLAMRERDRIRKSAISPTAGDLLAHVYACVTLCGGLDREQAIQVAEGEFAAEHKQYPGGAGQAVDDLAKYLGAQDTLPPLTPDLLGEALLPVTFGEKGKGAAVTSRLAKVAAAGVASSLIRSAQDFGYAGEPWPLEWLKSLIADGQNDPAVLMEIEGALPKDSLTLRELAVGITRSLIEAIAGVRGPSDSSSQYVQSELARLWNNLSNRQSDMGQRAPALASIEEAVRHYRALAEANPAAFFPNLAASLNNQANRQSDMGRRAAALASIEEAVRIRRNLIEADSDAFLPDLAMALNTQANQQSAMGQRAEALASIEEGVRHYRALAEGNADAFLPDLAASLNNQANRQIEMGQRAQALTSIEEAVRTRRTLAEGSPDTFLPNLAASLNNQANLQREMGQRVQALASIEEAVRIRRALAEGNRAAFLPNLAMSLNNQANLQSEVGQFAQALASIEEAVTHYRTLVEDNRAAFLPNLAMSLNNQANRQSEMEQRGRALATIEEAVAHYRALVDGNRAAFLPNLAMSLNTQANRQREMGLGDEALTSIEESVRHFRALAVANPDAFLPDLARSLSVLGACLEGKEKVKEGFDAAAESLAVLAPLFSKYPGVFDGLAGTTCRDYLTRSERLGMEPDAAVLSPYVRLFQQGGSNE
jgi:tetratricopeptide (TPR) repeat protein